MKQLKTKAELLRLQTIRQRLEDTGVDALPAIPEQLAGGDMPGDKILIEPWHVKLAKTILPQLLACILETMQRQGTLRVVVSICGGSGVGKSEVASLLSFYLNALTVGSYTLSGDNYPHRFPRLNDAERLRIFRETGLKGLLVSGEATDDRLQRLRRYMRSGQDAAWPPVKEESWMELYQRAGRAGLREYLGSRNELDFEELTNVIRQFKGGAERIELKRMGREDDELWYENVRFPPCGILVIEWTHGNSDMLTGVDIPVLLSSTPQQTLAHRQKRARDGAVDSAFTRMVLQLEQEMLLVQAGRAKLIVSKEGDFLTLEDYYERMRE